MMARVPGWIAVVVVLAVAGIAIGTFAGESWGVLPILAVLGGSLALGLRALLRSEPAAATLSWCLACFGGALAAFWLAWLLPSTSGGSWGSVAAVAAVLLVVVFAGQRLIARLGSRQSEPIGRAIVRLLVGTVGGGAALLAIGFGLHALHADQQVAAGYRDAMQQIEAAEARLQADPDAEPPRYNPWVSSDVVRVSLVPFLTHNDYRRGRLWAFYEWCREHRRPLPGMFASRWFDPERGQLPYTDPAEDSLARIHLGGSSVAFVRRDDGTYQTLLGQDRPWLPDDAENRYVEREVLPDRDVLGHRGNVVSVWLHLRHRGTGEETIALFDPLSGTIAKEAFLSPR